MQVKDFGVFVSLDATPFRKDALLRKDRMTKAAPPKHAGVGSGGACSLCEEQDTRTRARLWVCVCVYVCVCTW